MNARQWLISVASLFVAALFLLMAMSLFIASPGVEMGLIAGVLVLGAVLLVAQAGKPLRAELAKQAQQRRRHSR